MYESQSVGDVIGTIFIRKTDEPIVDVSCKESSLDCVGHNGSYGLKRYRHDLIVIIIIMATGFASSVEYKHHHIAVC